MDHPRGSDRTRVNGLHVAVAIVALLVVACGSASPSASTRTAEPGAPAVSAAAGDSGRAPSDGPAVSRPVGSEQLGTAPSGTNVGPSGSGTPAATLRTVDPNVGRIVVPEAGFELTLPYGWRRIPLDGSALEHMKDAFAEGSDFATLFAGAAGQAALQGIRLMAIDLRPESLAAGYPGNLNVIAQPGGGRVAPALLRELLVGQLRSTEGVSEVTADELELGPGTTVRLTSFITIPLAGATTLQTYAIQYAIAWSDDLYLVSYSCPADQVEACHDASFPSILSFALVPST